MLIIPLEISFGRKFLWRTEWNEISLSNDRRATSRHNSLRKRRGIFHHIPRGPRLIANYSILQVYIAEADGIMEYGASSSLGKRLVAVKFLTQNASEKEK